MPEKAGERTHPGPQRTRRRQRPSLPTAIYQLLLLLLMERVRGHAKRISDIRLTGVRARSRTITPRTERGSRIHLHGRLLLLLRNHKVGRFYWI